MANHFALKAAMESGRKVLGISPEVLTLFQSHPWPGNVRQLENLIQWAVTIGETEYVVSGDIPEDFFSANATESKPNVRSSTLLWTKPAATFASRPFPLRKGTAPLPRNSWDFTEILYIA
jgi:DNA-binding NtrC family response regulator